MKKDISNNENVKIQEMLESYLRFRSAAKTQNEAGMHLDEDALNAFIEGSVSRRENDSMVAHLVDCSFCLHRSAELSQLRAVFEDSAAAFEAPSAQPAKVSEVLNGLLSRLFGGSEGVVFAHEEKKEDEQPAEEVAEAADEDKKSES